MTLFSLPLMLYSSYRTSLLVSVLGTMLCLIILPVLIFYELSSNITLLFILLYSFMFGLGLGTIPHIIGYEILSSEQNRALIISVGCLINWLCNLGITIIFPSLDIVLQQSTISFFGFLNAALFIFVFVFFPRN